MKAIRIHEFGGPEVLRLDDVELEDPGPGEIRVRHAAIGLNYIDTYHRSGSRAIDLPSGIGLEAAGAVEAVGPGVADVCVGDRVAYGTGPIGAYSEARNIAAGRVIRLPDTIADDTAAAMMLKGMTVRYLLRETYPAGPGETILFHAAAGGTGLIAGQWAPLLGVRAIGTAGGPEKVERALAHGYAHVIDYLREDVVERVMDITEGRGVPVVHDGVGRATLEMSLACLRPRGLLVSFGSASGPVSALDLADLTGRSLYVTRPTLFTYVEADEDLRANAADLIDVVASGRVRIEIDQRFPLADAAAAHRALEGRETTGSTVLVP